MTAAAATTLALALAPGVAVAAPASAPSTADKQWMSANAQTDVFEIMGGALAGKKATTPVNRGLAAETRADHIAVLAKLRALAQTAHVSLPTSPSSMQQGLAQQLTAAPTDRFDAMYDRFQVAGHQMSIAMTRQEIASGQDPAVVSFARYYLPIAQRHLNHAEMALQGQVSTMPSGAANTGGGSTAGVEDKGALVGGGTAVLAGLALAVGVGRRFRST